MADVSKRKNQNVAEGSATKGLSTNGSPALFRDVIQPLRKMVKGRVILPGDPGYDENRILFYGGFDHHPAAIVRVASAEDIAHVVSTVRGTGLELAVRSGGHSVAGHGLSDGGIVIDLRDMKALQINPETQTAWAETGLTAGEFTTAADAYSLATGFGDTGSVGIGGITLGGGIGFMVRKYGMTIDQLLAAEMVTADGQFRRVDAEHDPDLFWAIRGGGGNFGVATRFLFRLHEVGEVVGGMLFLPASPKILADFIAEAEAAPEELSTIATVMVAPPMPFVPPVAHGKLVIMAMMVCVGNIEAGLRAVEPFRKLAPPVADMLRPMRYPEMFPPDASDYHPTAVAHTMFMDRVDLAVAETICETIQSTGAPMHFAQLRVMGGAMARVPADATAYFHRQSRMMTNLAAFYKDPEDLEKQQSWVNSFAATLNQGDSGAYVNFLGDESEERIRAAYPGATWDRLRRIKARYDPDNLFRLNQNIPPAHTPSTSRP